MILTCVHCGKRLNVPPKMLGRTGRCPVCRGVVRFPRAEVAAPAAPPQEPTGEEAEVQDPRRLRDRAISLGLAVLLHVAVLMIFGAAVVSPGDGGGGLGAGAEVTIAELPGVELTDAPDEGELEAAVTPASEAEFVQPVEVASATEGAVTDEALAMAPLPSGGAPASGGVGLEFSTAGGGAGGGLGTARFMGVEGKGRRFCIIADRSGSMAGPKLAFVKAEILKTLGDLGRGAEFYVIFFDDVAEPMPSARWLSGRNAVAQVAPWINAVFDRGGTNPLPAFQLAFTLNPLPDTIFFMTDGLFSPNIPPQVAALNNRRKKVVIHAISFVDRSAESLMRQIAEQSGGTYRHVDAP